ncbi:diguanylate cyclase/phosphodiesterase (GGDEF & EAL domains) with PAS/PAC sensor(s) [hydrothermal vent metagenome]|uniref:Diguanylate cyclase/phosphodiesterase (GGDEF & EAL domains) with PAS/PAC sensor(S) n=1 Tax=hydrothermal vent metagenome TaxID=652676 RepID=A0A3B0XFF0_9ZZZZ
MKSYIAKKLILYTVLFSSVITLIITAIQLYTEFQYDVKGIYQKLEQIKISYQQSITQSVWVSDREQLQTILDGITELPDIVYAGVIIKNYNDISSGAAPQGENIEFNIDLRYEYNHQDLLIGQFVVVASLADVYSRLLNRLWIILLSNAFKTSLVAAFIYYLFSRLVTRHLSRISEFSENHNSLSSDKVLTLDRKQGKHDELDSVVEKINDMHTWLHEQIAEINHQKKYLSQTLNSIGDAVITTDEEGNVTRLNPVAEKLTGWTSDEALSLPLKTIFPIVNASTRDPVENPVEKVLATGETVYLSNHTTLISKGGKEYQIADSAAPILDGTQILGMVLVFNDVTEQYRMREKLVSKELEQREILQSMVDAVITIDENGTVCTFNHSAENVFGYSVDEVLGKNINCLMPEPYASEHDDYLRNYTLTGKKYVIGKGRDVKGLRKNNETFPMHLLVAELPTDTEGKRRFIGSCIDLTELREHEDQIRRSQKMDALGKLTGGIAHDYNNMLGVVLGYSELLKDMLEQPKHLDYVSKIIHAGERGARLTKKLLAFSRNRSSDVKKININILLREARHMLEKTLTARIQLDLKLEKDLFAVCLDESELEDAVLNICINAMHAIEGNGRLTIETENIQVTPANAGELEVEEGFYARLSITDTGSGMDEATREKIFDPFFTTKGEKGTGLGLSQVYGFMNRCGGAIKVESELQQGTCFILYFPQCQGGESVNKNQTEDPADTILKGKESILVVDDEPALLDLTREILSQHNYRVFSAKNAEQALAILAKEHIDLLMLDIIMPDMSGCALARIVQEKYPEVKVQLVSGFPGEEHSEQSDLNLSENLLYKPYNAHSLLIAIRGLLQ